MSNGLCSAKCKKQKGSAAGNRTRVIRVTGGYTNHYTIADYMNTCRHTAKSHSFAEKWRTLSDSLLMHQNDIARSMATRSHSSVGQSVRLITVRSAVRARVGPVSLYLNQCDNIKVSLSTVAKLQRPQSVPISWWGRCWLSARHSAQEYNGNTRQGSSCSH